MSLGYFLNPFGTVEKIVINWNPKGCRTEKDFESSLVSTLEKELPDKRIQRQYGSGRQRVDIVIDDKIPIEIKKDLKTTAIYQRLIGQLEEYLKKWDNLILVLTGDIDQDLFISLKTHCNEKTDVWGEEKISIITKKSKYINK